MLLEVVDLRSRMLAFRGACGEPVVSPVTLLPQDKEGYGSDTSHEENVMFIFEDLAPSTPINLAMKLIKQKPS
ncbi:hypothetical protein LCY76_20290 [Fictibacillus sp. KIGAM418]|uniref:Uncharacterized protein n=1 Tax=Fictibacillus marinisediminis TaxID=2878389 RepID=A0A9X1XJW6_9BACL|nr:hypothetical protein [Fictibacillus marinisediminis]MCK6258914.1 hypothetical protein [Fictibacillus marinisediminis]